MKKLFIVSIACVMCASLSMLTGCNTAKGTGEAISDVGNGVGKDVSSLGR